MALCPGEAIKRKDAVVQGAVKGRSKIYCCENGAAGAVEEVLPSLGECVKAIDVERVACGGSVSADRLAVDFRDYKTVIIACCVEDACRHMDGDRRACKQSLRTAELLQKAGLASRRIEVIKASHVMGAVMKDKILGILEGQT